VGRYACKIDSGVASLQGKKVSLVHDEKDTAHCLHSGAEGFSHKFWSVKQQSTVERQHSLSHYYKPS